eukprot:4075692-Alexandrium_andersonii.AAC.1
MSQDFQGLVQLARQLCPSAAPCPRTPAACASCPRTSCARRTSHGQLHDPGLVLLHVPGPHVGVGSQCRFMPQ